MTVQDIALRCLKYIGVVSLDPAHNTTSSNKRGLVAGDLDDVAACITGALQEIFRLGPTALSEQPFADVLRPPTPVSATVTQFSKVISGFIGFATWMKGCTVRLPDGNDNELVSATELVKPYMGATMVGAPGTAYGDAVQISASFQNVMEPVRIPNVVQLGHAASREEFRLWAQPHRYGNPVAANYMTTINKTIAEPAVWFSEGRYDPTLAAIIIFLRVNPMPAQAYQIDYRIKRRPPIILAADIGDHTSEPSTVLPIDLHESVLLPFTLQRFTAHPAFDNEAAKREIARQYEVGKLILESLNPPIGSTRAYYPQ